MKVTLRTPEDVAAEAAELVLRNARRAAGFAFMCMIVVGLLLLIDGQRNRVLLTQIQEARRILDEFNVSAGLVVLNGTAANGAGHVAGSSGVGGPADPGDDAGRDSGDADSDDASERPATAAGGPEAGEAPAVPWPQREGLAGRAGRDV